MGTITYHSLGLTNFATGRHIVKFKLKNNLPQEHIQYISLFVNYGLKGIRIPKKCPVIIPWYSMFRDDIPNLVIEWIDVDSRNSAMKNGNRINMVVNKNALVYQDYEENEIPANTLLLGTQNTVVNDDVNYIYPQAMLSPTPSVKYPSSLLGIGWGAINTKRVDVDDIATLFGIMCDGSPNIQTYRLYVDGEELTELNIAQDTVLNYKFSGCESITKITIDKETINGMDALPNLTTLILGSNVKNVAGFSQCPNLVNLTLPNGLLTIGYNAFSDCTSLTSVTIPSSVTSIGSYAFSGCTSLPVVNNIRYADTLIVEITDKTQSAYTIKDGTKFINGFRDCTNLTSITLPNNTLSIGESCFMGCTGLSSITIPNGVTSIGSASFNGCTGLTTIVIPNTVTNLGNASFYGCTNLTSVTLSDALTTIGYNMFYNCKALTDINIPNNVTTIGNYAFCGCESITNITLPSGLTQIGDSSFSGCTGLTSITIPDGVSIGNSAFKDCSALSSVTLGNNVIPSARTFYGTPYYNTLPDGELVYNNVLTEWKGAFTSNISLTNGITAIGDNAFSTKVGNTKISKLNIPSTVSVLGVSLFGYSALASNVEITFNSLNPPTITNDDAYFIHPMYFPQLKIYVPAEAVDTYKASTQYGWQILRDYIFAKP